MDVELLHQPRPVRLDGLGRDAEDFRHLPGRHSLRDELEDLIRTKFKNHRAFCQATGISEDMLSHVLAGRKDLSLETLTQALQRIGYALHILPEPEFKQTG